MLREGARRFLEEHSPPERVRQVSESEDGYDRELWEAMATQGWQGMHIPEEWGGAGFTFQETAILLHEMGRVLAPVPYLSSSVLAAAALMVGGSDEQKKEWLGVIAAGEIVATVAIAEPGGGWDQPSIKSVASPGGSGFTLDGTKSYVTAGHTADMVLVAAGNGDGVGFFLVRGADVQAEKLVTLDSTRPQAIIELSSVPAQRLGEGGWDTVEHVYDLARVALAAEQVGGAERVLEMAVAYAKDRMQFGRAIGSFQAIKHMCADMLMELEAARSAASYAAWTVATLRTMSPRRLRWRRPTARKRSSAPRPTTFRSTAGSASRGNTTPTCISNGLNRPSRSLGLRQPTVRFWPIVSAFKGLRL